MSAVGNLYGPSGPVQTQYDDGRVIRDFVNFANDAFGDGQTLVTYDGSMVNPPGQFTLATPDGVVSVMGQPVSSIQSAPAGGVTISPQLLLLALGAFLIFKK
jgi:hypothetical protein